MNITGLKNKKKHLIQEIKRFERRPHEYLTYEEKRLLHAFRSQVNWIGKEINRLKAERKR